MAQRTLSRRGRRSEDDYDEYDDHKATKYDDEDEDDRPRGRRRRRDGDDDDEPEKPRGRSRSRSRDEDDEEDDDRPARGRSRRARDDGDDKPRSRRASSRTRDADDDEDDRPRRSRRDDDDRDRRPRGRSDRGRGERGSRGATSSTVGKGWQGYEGLPSGGDWIKTWAVPKKPTLIKFLDGEPFSTYAEHWLDEQKGKKSFVCLGEDCPLCDELGDRPSGYALFNILDLTDPDHPKVEVWKTGKRVAGMLRNFADDKKTSPLNREDLYWSIFKSGEKGGNVQTNLNPVKARDLVEDWDCEPFTDEELDEFEEKLHTEEEIITISPRKDLRAIARSYDD